MANMILGMIILNKRYTKVKYLSVIIISIGITACTIVSGQSVSSNKNQATEYKAGEGEGEGEPAMDFMWWMVGIAMLTFALFMSARMGIYQEVIYAKYGKHSDEALFYCVRSKKLKKKCLLRLFFLPALSAPSFLPRHRQQRL